MQMGWRPGDLQGTHLFPADVLEVMGPNRHARLTTVFRLLIVLLAGCALAAPIRLPLFGSAQAQIHATDDGDLGHGTEPPWNLLDPNPWRPSLSYSGGTGLIDMPTARFMADGMIALSGSGKQPDQRAAFLFQATPWAEGVFRYAHINGFLTDQPNFYDRSFAVKIRLMEEGTVRPALAVGLSDLLGTGVYGGEYLVASKRFGDLDASLGLGWGRFGSSGALINPLSRLDDAFASREGRTLDDTGQFDFGSYFSGPDVGLFGGIEYTPPVASLDGLKFQVEYSSDRYLEEEAAPLVNFDQRSPVNLGVSYQPADWIELGSHYLYGTTLGVRFAVKADPSKRTALSQFGAQAPLFRVRPELSRKPPEDPPVSVQEFERLRRIPNPLERAGTPALSPRTGFARGITDLRGADPSKQSLMNRSLEARQESNSSVPLTVSRRYLGSSLRLTRKEGLCTASGSVRAKNPKASACDVQRARKAAIRRADLTPSRSRARERMRKMAERTVQLAGGQRLEIGPAATRFATDKALFTAIEQEADDLYITVQTISRNDATLKVTISNRRYDRAAQALGRIVRVLSRLAPDDIDIFDITLTTGDLPVTRMTLSRAGLERVLLSGGGTEEILTLARFEPGSRETVGTKGAFPSVGFGLRPGFRQSLFDPDDPFRYQFLLNAGLAVSLAPGLTLETSAGINLINNFDEITRESDSALPRVRSDFARYLQEGATGLTTLQLSYRFKLGRQTFARFTGGILEEMFAGVGGEILFKPHGKPWALGGNLFAVQQRDFDKGFRLRDYQTVTGHGSLYYDLPFHDYTAVVHAGRYLAGDYGATFELKRRFDTGVEIGAFATLTNVPFDEFGEGSFDKGLIIRIPFGWFSPFPTREEYRIDLRPLTRDGGQRLTNTPLLFEEIRHETVGEVVRNFDGFTD